MEIKKILFYCIFLISFISKAQVGIGTVSPNASSMLDITSNNKGLLIPRVSLTSSSDVTTIASPTTSLFIIQGLHRTVIITGMGRFGFN